ncbi:TusE/DsrC/DsvC family sulfur relay protein, partial [Candidatus Parcubacteria bacterium]
MSVAELAGKTVEVDEEGFLVNPNDWTPEMAPMLAKEVGIEELTEAHWKVINWCREAAADSGKSPTLRQITTGTGIS